MIFVSLERTESTDNSGSREGQMEGLLAPARYIRRSTGVKVTKQIDDGFSKNTHRQNVDGVVLCSYEHSSPSIRVDGENVGVFFNQQLRLLL
ncbi:hypothetical protein ANCDUO_06761 [Ancylostoma duodenale]|uniref:Uncharacterized protein n=1 Tax=Ancylostoma duodenale TaxID=51022 RepID=A0A0C2H0T7_9BILA|nr:hypothetical protein ANCDUO_06761 [Ancylostoma duodenale]